MVNYCDWDCHIAHAKSEGAVVITPNNLPIRCIGNNTLLECEHGDHPDYMFPVNAIPKDKNDFEELHALIYQDGHVALTLYECCYTLWNLSTGESYQYDFTLSKKSLEKIREYNEKKSSLKMIEKE
jgi:hypothetical protein